MANLVATNFGEVAALTEILNSASGLTTGLASSAPFSFAGNGRTVSNNGNAATHTLTLPNLTMTEVYWHIAVTCGGPQTYFWVGESGITHITVDFSGTVWRIWRGTNSGTLLASGSTTFTVGTVVDLQVRVKVDSTVGVVEVRINGSTTAEVSFSGNTKNGGSGFAYLWACSTTSGGGDTWTDLVINDTTGSAENSWTGAVRVIVENPTAAGADGTAWTPLASTNLSNIDDTLPGGNDGDTTYNETTTVGAKDFFTWGSSAWTGFSPQLIHFVRVKYWAKAQDGGSHTMRSFAKRTSTVNGTTVNLGPSYIRFEDVYYTDPSTSAAWADFAAIAAAEFGYELVS